MRFSTKAELALLCLVFAAPSCRQILDIEPGHLAATASSGGSTSTDGGAEAGDGAGGSSGAAGATSAGGAGGRNVGGARASGGTGNPQGGKTGAGGTTDIDAQDGTGGTTAAPLLPDSDCAACFERHCAPEKTACEADPNCASGVPAWLDCAPTDGGTCIAADPGTLQSFETCGATSCGFCQHLTDGEPSIEILSPSNGASITVDATNLIPVTVKVRNFTVKTLGNCAFDDFTCGHIHINLDGDNCHVNPFFNTYTGVADADGIAETSANVLYCVTPVFDRTVKLRASLSSNVSHIDRIPAIETSIEITPHQ